eukprot:7052389-Ditylum_brightwellii.AAC.1
MWYHPTGIANILAFHKAKDKWHVTYDSHGGNTFTIHKPTHGVHFTESGNGLYYHDALNRSVTLCDAEDQ